MKKTDFIKKPEYQPQRTDPAEKTPYPDRKKYDSREDGHFTRQDKTESAEARPQTPETGLSRAGRTDVFTECRGAYAEFICKNHGKHQHKSEKKKVFKIFQPWRERQLEFSDKDQLLKKTERAQPPAEKTPQKHRGKSYQTENVEKSRKTLPQAQGEKLLEHPHGTGREGKRAGMAVQNRNTDIFKLSFVKPAGQKSFKITVYQEKGKDLGNSSFMAADLFSFHRLI